LADRAYTYGHTKLYNYRFSFLMICKYLPKRNHLFINWHLFLLVAAIIEATFLDQHKLKEEISKSLKIVEENDNYGLKAIESGLEGADLIAEIRKHRIRFGSSYSAAYHADKHWARRPGAYVNEANSQAGIARNSETSRVSTTSYLQKSPTARRRAMTDT
jgi:hypothetical protein